MIKRVLILLIILNIPHISYAGAGEDSHKPCKDSEVEIHITSHINKTKTELHKICISKDRYDKLKKSNGILDFINNMPGSTFNDSIGSTMNQIP
jgi:hypothetical protein